MDSVFHSLIWAIVVVLALFFVTSCDAKKPRIIGQCKLIVPQGEMQ